MAEMYPRPTREEIARCPRCGHRRFPLTLGHFWACVLPVLERRRG